MQLEYIVLFSIYLLGLVAVALRGEAKTPKRKDGALIAVYYNIAIFAGALLFFDHGLYMALLVVGLANIFCLSKIIYRFTWLGENFSWIGWTHASISVVLLAITLTYYLTGFTFMENWEWTRQVPIMF